MIKLLLGLVLLYSSCSWADSLPVTFDDLRPRLLLQARQDFFEVESNPEIAMPDKDQQIALTLSEYHQKGLYKDHLYRVSIANSFNTYANDPQSPNTVYGITVEELDQNLQPTGNSIDLGAKAAPQIVVANFAQIRDPLSQNPSLIIREAKVGDQLINSLPVTLNNQTIPANTTFDVIKVFKEHIPYTWTHRYTLTLREIHSKKLYTLTDSGLAPQPLWAHLIAPQNRRVIKYKAIEIHY
ncbi:MAG TPA: hypothetical protein VF412_06575 [Bdellovibrio sp.]|uniref:hypothetical protein n=1 Tax=Bdellovibrio sp. TaxID=28201 RepID=UPI002F20EC0B